MGNSPLSGLRASYKLVENPHLLGSKHTELTNFYGKELGGVLRYMFHGFIVPEEIQDAVIVLRKNLHTLQKGAKITTQSDNSIYITINELSVSENSHTITFTNTNGKEETITFSLQNDPSRGDFPTTEIVRKERLYRSVPYHGDVRNHLHHQHTFYEHEYLNHLVKDLLITPEDKETILLFHQIHDIPEMIKGDKHVNDKTGGDAQHESDLIRTIIQNSNIPYTAQELELIAHSFRVFEQPGNYFKGGERLNYILDALRIHKAVQHFFHDHTKIIGNILRNQLPYFLDEKNVVRVTPLVGPPKKIPFKELSSSRQFLITYGGEIGKILETPAYTDIKTTWDKIVALHNL